MNHTRPKNLNLFTIRFPISAIISILHRVSGVILFLLIPVVIGCLSFSLTEPGFENLQGWLTNPLAKFIFWILLAPFCYHLVAGIRHLLMDAHIGTSKRGGRLSSILTLIISILLVILAGVWLW